MLLLYAPLLLCASWGVHPAPVAPGTGPGSECWNSLQKVCPFEAGSACGSCAGAQQQPLRRAGCSSAAISEYCSGGIDPSLLVRRVEHLSSARRNIGAASAGGSAVFAGGCNMSGSNTEFICNTADPAVDVFGPSGSLNTTVYLSEPRGWICAAPAAGGNKVVMAGGGTVGDGPHSRRADVYNLVTGELTTFPSALSVGRWGIGCTLVGNRTYFVGGKVTISGYDNAWTTGVIDYYTEEPPPPTAAAAGGLGAPDAGSRWVMNPVNLTVPRESVSALDVGGRLLVAGGWKKANGKYQGDNTVELFGPNAESVSLASYHLASNAYSVGAATSAKGIAYIVGNTYLYLYNATDEYNSALLGMYELPAPMVGVANGAVGGGVVPKSHVQQNGVGLNDEEYGLVCFYGGGGEGVLAKTLTPALYCYATTTGRWQRFPCSTAHKGGALAVTGGGGEANAPVAAVLIAGGFDPASENTQATDVVDVYTIAKPPPKSGCDTCINGVLESWCLVDNKCWRNVDPRSPCFTGSHEDDCVSTTPYSSCKCKSCSDPACQPTPTQCSAALTQACGTEKSQGSSKCLVCCGEHTAALHSAGCTQADFTHFCGSTDI